MRPGRAGDRDRRLRALDQRHASPTTRSAAPPRSRTSSCCSPARRRSECRRPPTSTTARAGGDRRRDEPRGRQLPHLLEGDDVLQPARADDLPARLRPRARLDDRRRGRRARLRRVRRHRDGRDRGDLLQRAAGDVRHLRQAPLPAHLRRDPRGAGRRRGAGHRRDALDRAARRASTAASRCWSRSRSASTRPGGCCWSRSSASSPRSASPSFGIAVAGTVDEDRPVQLRDHAS